MDEEEALAKAGPEGARLKRAADAEKLDNEQDLNRRRGDPVLYGQIVQLLHRASMRYVRTSSTTTSRLEPRFVACRCFALMSISNTLYRDLNVSYWSLFSHLRVDLHEETTKHSWFKIMPRYKVHAEGDRIRMNDQVRVCVFLI